MINVGVIGLGMMGITHLDIYCKHKDVKVVAVSDIDPDRLSGHVRVGGNIEGQTQGAFDLKLARQYDEGVRLIRDPDIQLVDICLPTPLHVKYALKALKAGKHVMVEKPLGRTAREADKLAQAASESDSIVMPGMCMRFWPGWDWLKQAVTEGRYGRVLSASFQRLASHPGLDSPFYGNGEACGGAALDLHIHDTDFIQWCFGVPKSVSSRGYSSLTSALDHITTQYEYGSQGPVVTAEGGWAMAPGFAFVMRYTVNFQQATAVFDLAAPTPLTLSRGGKSETVAIDAGQGYEREIDYLLQCLASGQNPKTVTLDDAATSVRIVEAEVRSAMSGKRVRIK